MNSLNVITLYLISEFKQKIDNIFENYLVNKIVSCSLRLFINYCTNLLNNVIITIKNKIKGIKSFLLKQLN